MQLTVHHKSLNSAPESVESAPSNHRAFMGLSPVEYRGKTRMFEILLSAVELQLSEVFPFTRFPYLSQ